MQEIKKRLDDELAGGQLAPEQEKILQSMRRHWEGLTVFVEHPHVPMDNNAAERALRALAVARKNFYGSRSQWSGELAMGCFTILATLRQHGICPRRYCGREFSPAELDHIRELLEIRPALGRVAVSRRICQDLGWLNVLGQPKEMSCRVALLRMEKDGLMDLPPSVRKKGRRQRRFQLSAASDPREPVQASVRTLEPLVFERVEKSSPSSLWNELDPEVSLLGLPASEWGSNASPGLERRRPAFGRAGVRGLRLASQAAR
ncbi:MAG: transposase [Terriglobales bacterium]